MEKSFAIRFILAITATITATMSWHMFHKTPNTVDRSRMSAIILSNESMNVVSEVIRQPITDIIIRSSIVNHANGPAEEMEDCQNVKEIDQKMALEIARSAIGKTKYSGNLPIVVKNEDSEYCVIFSVDKKVPTGTRYRGSDFAAEVRINKKTAKVVQVWLGE